MNEKMSFLFVDRRVNDIEMLHVIIDDRKDLLERFYNLQLYQLKCTEIERDFFENNKHSVFKLTGERKANRTC